MSTVESGLQRERAAGFTMVELMVALLISGLLTTVIFQVMYGNSRFVANQTAREEVQQNTRAALDLIASDIRSASADGLVAWSANAIRLRVPRAWGVTCNPVDVNATNVWALFPANTFPPDFALDAPHWGFAINQTNDPTVTVVGASAFRFLGGVLAASTANPCPAVQPQMAGLEARGFRRQGAATLANAGLTIPAGTPMMIYEEIAYDVATGTGGEPWVRRSAGMPGGNPNMQPMAGPVPDAGSLRFTYLQQDGATPAVTPAQVRLVRVRLVTQSRGRIQRDGVMRPEQIDSATVDVYLRNSGT